VRLAPPGTSCCPPRRLHVGGVGPPRTLLRRASPRVPGPAGARRREPRAAPSTTSPTPLIAFCCLRKISSRLHRGCAKCGELELVQVNGLSTGDSHVGNQGTNPRLRPQSSSGLRLSTVVHRLSTGYPPGLSPGLCIASGRYRLVVPRTFNRKSTRLHRRWTELLPTVSVHIDFPRTCPHLWGWRPGGCPPLGIKPVNACELVWITLARHSCVLTLTTSVERESGSFE
jgi:hypothetical protein